MSKIDNIKEDKEEKCLEKAIMLARTKKAKTRYILNLCAGNKVKRRKNDRPDIIRMINRPGDPLNGCYIGIEHFLVDQVSKQKSGKLHSVSSEYQNQIQKVYEKGKKCLEAGGDVSEDIKQEMAENAFGYATSIHETHYDNILYSLKYGLEKHLEKIEEYRSEIQSIAGDRPYKLAFLIEISCLVANSFLNIGHRIIPNTDELIPMTDDIVKIFDTVDAQKLDYIILYIHQPHKRDVSDVIAIETGDIVSSLRKQGVHIFRYCGDNMKIHFDLHELERAPGERFTFKYDILLSHSENSMNQIMPGLRAAYEARSQGIPLFCTRMIQEYMYALGNKVDFFEKEPGNWFVRSEYPQPIVLQRYYSFLKKYPITENDDNME